MKKQYISPKTVTIMMEANQQMLAGSNNDSVAFDPSNDNEVLEGLSLDLGGELSEF